jgi:hypothetical protein
MRTILADLQQFLGGRGRLDPCRFDAAGGAPVDPTEI